MDQIRFHQIIDFAVQREKEAVELYSCMRKTAKFDAHKELLQEIENMEKGHILILEEMRSRGSFHNIDKVVKNLKISEYTVLDSEVDPNSYQGILLIAMKNEEQSYLLYRDLAERVANEDKELSKLFKHLANEEASHKLEFETLYDEDVMKDN